MTFTPEKTSEANREKANNWLDKAVRLEADGKSKKMVAMALDRACEYEDAA
jgi:hypothetical protein